MSKPFVCDDRSGPRARLPGVPVITQARAVLLTLVALVSLAALTAAPSARAASGPLGIDHRLSYDNAGIWKRSNQDLVLYGMTAAVGFGALWEGGRSEPGRTFWQAVDATAIAGASTFALKFAFSRERPRQTSDPNKWFTGHGNDSFPSGDVTVTSALVAPFVFEYGPKDPAVYALEILPIYDAFARMKTWGHWQTDVLAGFAIGTLSGYLVHRLPHPLILSLMPNAIYVGLKMHF